VDWCSSSRLKLPAVYFPSGAVGYQVPSVTTPVNKCNRDVTTIKKSRANPTAVSTIDHRIPIIFEHNWLVPHVLGLGGLMMGFGLLGTVLVALLIVYLVRRA
jgi:hypothetical protein